MKVLRRLTTLVPAPVTTSPAPPRARGVDVTAESKAVAAPAPRVVADRPHRALERLGVALTAAAEPRPLSTPSAHSSLPSGPPSWTPGTCYHHGHIELDGERVGVYVLNDRDASLLRCSHVNEDGR